MANRYAAIGPEAEFEPGSRNRVLRNRLGIRTVSLMDETESLALQIAQDWAVRHFGSEHRFRLVRAAPPMARRHLPVGW